MMDSKNREVYRWPLLAGLALVVGIQLHTLLLLIMPVMTIIVLVYLTQKKNVNWNKEIVQQIIENPMLNGETIRLDGAIRLAAR